MSFNIASNRIEAGHYRLSHGEADDGYPKATAIAWLNDLAKGWELQDGSDGIDVVNKNAPYKRYRDLKEAWGAWANHFYNDDKASSFMPKSDYSPAVSPVPPSRSTKSIEDFIADPFDPQFRYPSDHERKVLRKMLTPLGMLCEIKAWIERKGHEKIFGDLYVDVNACLKRELGVDNTDEQLAPDEIPNEAGPKPAVQSGPPTRPPRDVPY